MDQSPETGRASPGVSAVRTSDAAEELVRFTLSSFLSGDGDFSDLALSKDYCSRLLQVDPITVSQHPNDARSSSGVPEYPLYKHLARELGQWIETGTFPKSTESVVKIPIGECADSREIELLDKLILEIGSELSNFYDAVDFELHVQEPFFSQLKDGSKKVEGRLAAGNYNKVDQGSLLLFNKSLLLKVERVTRYSSFAEMLQAETLSNVLPGVETIEEGVLVYRKFYTEEREKSSGVLAISVSKPDSQPYTFMKEILNGLGYEGIGRLLGMKNTIGSVLDGLPPPRSALMSSSMKPHQPDMEGYSLTDAARALAKHVDRSSEKWWGRLHGNDLDKNKLAQEVINRLIADCCWMNVHLMQPFGSVFEIRVCEGYGARWSQDGSKFIGFLEPYTAEGYSMGWRH